MPVGNDVEDAGAHCHDQDSSEPENSGHHRVPQGMAFGTAAALWEHRSSKKGRDHNYTTDRAQTLEASSSQRHRKSVSVDFEDPLV